ncbi:2-phospho-L-lactate transferase [Pseudomaricurvus sp.]|uniref:2-phospho-L-lactate transferase n=1 Tax=Pseudomaricurvus sp. TaxID=2004510 RepID=UPI003F6C8316
MTSPAITVITGGVGGAKFVEGLYHSVNPQSLCVIPNIGDDDQFHGLWVSPDVDTLVYTLSEHVNRDTGWGMAGDTFATQEQLALLGQEVWMNLGDKDLATHIVRTLRLHRGESPSDVAAHLARSLGLECQLMLPTDSTLQTRVHTEQGELSLEEYFVKHRCAPQVTQVRYRGAENAQITVAAEAAIREADCVFFAPSNPLLSIAPTLEVNRVRQTLHSTTAKRIAISPLVGGKAVKGPTCEVMRACGFEANVFGIAEFYRGLIDTLVIDQKDAEHAHALRKLGLEVVVLVTLMDDKPSRIAFAAQVLSSLDLAPALEAVS